MPSPPRKHRFSPERRRAIELLASSSGGVNAALLVHIHGFKSHVLARLVRRKLAASERRVAMAGGRTPEEVRIKITAAGQRGLSSEGRKGRGPEGLQPP